jgi:predicted dinucleotide-binding enzyme
MCFEIEAVRPIRTLQGARMNIAIIGAGNVGSGLAACLVAAGHRVSLAASRPDSPRVLQAAHATGASATTPVDAAVNAELVVLAVLRHELIATAEGWMRLK